MTPDDTLTPLPEPMADIGALLRRHVVLPDGAVDAVALWVVMTYCYDNFAICPKLVITSAETRCGKSTLLELIAALVSRGLIASEITAAAIDRIIEAAAPTLCIDEGDTFIRGNEATDEREPMRFTTSTPMLIVMINDPTNTITDRAIPVRLRRKLPGESAEKLPRDLFDGAAPIRRRLLRWANDHAEALRAARPEPPPHPNDWVRDNWMPLFAIAETIGADWPERARASFAALTPSNGA